MDASPAEFERDLELLRTCGRDMLDLAKRRALAPVGWDYDEFYHGGVLYLLELAKRAGREHTPDLAVLLALAKGGLALTREYGSSLRGDVGAAAAHDLFLLRTVNDANRALLRLHREPVASYGDLLAALDEAFPERTLPFGGLVRVLRDRVGLAATARADPDALEAARRDVVLILSRFQLVLGVTLKWNLVAQARWLSVGGGASRLHELREEYGGPILQALEPMRRLLRTFGG